MFFNTSFFAYDLNYSALLAISFYESLVDGAQADSINDKICVNKPISTL